MDLGKVGVWWSGTWRRADGADAHVAADLEALGYSAIWSSGGFNPGLSTRFERLLADSDHTAVASGIVNIWLTPAEQIASAVARLDATHSGRFLLGLGASHSALVENYSHPYSHMLEYLDALDAAEPPVPKDRRVLAALGPRMLDLAARRAAGAHPYLVPVEHTARARQTMGSGPLLAPELTAIIERDPGEARARARAFTSGYLALPNYASNLRSLGFDDDDFAGGGSDRLVDAVVAWGGVEAIADRVHEHHEAGADHVCVQVITQQEGFPLSDYRALAPVVVGR